MGSRNSGADSIKYSVLEDHIIAILDASVNSTCSQYTNDDRLEFLEAIRTSFFRANRTAPPSQKIVKEVFHILSVGESVELITESYCLLDDILKSFSTAQVSSSSENSAIKDVWSPLDFTSDSMRSTQKSYDRTDLIDSTGFHKIIENLFQVGNADNETEGKKLLRNMFLFQYIVDVLEIDFSMRKRTFKASMNWPILRESFLSTLLSSKRISYKNLITDSIHLLCAFSNASSESYNGPETCKTIRKFFISIFELDEARKEAEESGFTSRVDFARYPILEVIVNELSYEKDIISLFLQAFDEPKWKLQIVLQYFAKYSPMASVRTRRSDSPKEEMNFLWMMECFSTSSKSKNLTKKIGANVVQVLISHGFQVQLSLVDGKKCIKEICEAFVGAIRQLKDSNENLDILDVAREALFVASTIVASE